MARRHSSSGRRPTEWFGVFLDVSVNTTAETFRIFTELNLQEKGPFTVLRMIVNWSAQGTLEAEAPTLFAVAFRKVTLGRGSDTISDIGGTILDADYFQSDNLLSMFQEHTTPAFSQVDPTSGAVEVSTRGVASGVWDIKAKRKLQDPTETLVIDTELIGVGSAENIRLRACIRILIQPH